MASTSQPTPKQVSDYILNRGSIGNERKSIASQVSARIIANNPGYADQFRQRDEEERKRKEQEAIAQFQAKEQEAKNQQQYQNDFLASVGATTPDGQGGQTSFNPSGFKELASSAFDTTMNYSRGVADYAKDNGMGGVMAQTGIGAAKKVGEIASGIAKTGYGLSSASGYSTLRKIVSKVGGQEVAQYIDRNTPEYLKAVDAHIDDDGILNYKAKYDNDIQKVGGAAAEIGSYFMPVTRLNKVVTLEKALADIPKVAKALEATPKVVKVGGKLMYEVSKDIVDASLLDAVQGKSWEDIQETAKMAGIGGGALRVGGKLLGSALKSFKENRILDTVTKAIPEITKEEKALANELLSQGKPLDDVVTDILAKREDDGVDIFKGIDDAVDEVPVKTPENTPETPSKMPQDVPSEVKAPDVPTVAAKAEDPLLQEARKYKSESAFLYDGVGLAKKGNQYENIRHLSKQVVAPDSFGTPLGKNGDIVSTQSIDEAQVQKYMKVIEEKLENRKINELPIVILEKRASDGKTVILDGHNRAEAYRRYGYAGPDGVPVIWKDQLTDLYKKGNSDPGEIARYIFDEQGAANTKDVAEKMGISTAEAYKKLIELEKQGHIIGVHKDGLVPRGKTGANLKSLTWEPKSQLTDLYNKAQGGVEDSLIKEIRSGKYKSAEEFATSNEHIFDRSGELVKVGDKVDFSYGGSEFKGKLVKVNNFDGYYETTSVKGKEFRDYSPEVTVEATENIYNKGGFLVHKKGDKFKVNAINLNEYKDNYSPIKTKSQLTDLYNQANKVDRAAAKPEQAIPIVKETPQNLNKAPEVAPKVAPEVPKEGAVKANSDFAKRLNQILPEGDKIDETYDTVNMRKEIAAAEKNAAEDPEKLDRLAMGTEKSSTETQTAANIVAVEKAVEKGDYEKAATLLNARFKANNRRGQEISMEQVSAAMNPHERPMKDVMKQRLERLTNKEKDPVKAQEIVDKKVEATKQEIRKAVKPKIKIERAQKLLDDLICPV